MITAAICSFNRAERLPALIASLRQQKCRIPFNILVIDNNSTDNTQQILSELAQQPGPALRYVKETRQGIPFARNRAIDECLQQDFMFFMDDDELPVQGTLDAAIDALTNDNAECAGGRVENVFNDGKKPIWLTDDLLGFLAEIDHGDKPFWITNTSTPVWTANVAYRMEIFRRNETLRFDSRYNRLGKGIGGGSDLVLFKECLSHNISIRYRPDMVVQHRVEDWRLTRKYFLKLHYLSGRRTARYEMLHSGRKLFGVPLFLFNQAIHQTFKWFKIILIDNSNSLRQGMNATHSYGMIVGSFLRWIKPV